MSTSRLTLAAATLLAVLSASLFVSKTFVLAAAQATPPQNPAGGPPPGGPPREFPAPTNLKVLPRSLSGAEVHEIMEKWEGELGTGCKTCHAVDKSQPAGPNGRPKLNFADDSKEEKQTARLMFKMTEDINANYVSKIDSSGAPVTCGTCHRGKLGPEVFTPKSDHDHDHPAAPPAGAKPPAGL